jgi:L-fuculose-phosphate aldolase
MQRIYSYRMTTTSGGNLSIREPNGHIWITPSRVDKGGLRREDIVCVRSDGTIDGIHTPSSEFPFHRAIYAVRPDIGAIVHAHSVALVAFSICRAVPNTRLLHGASHVCGETGFAPYALPGSMELAESIVAVFKQGYFAVILENHGVVVGGTDLQNAFQRFETLEFAAKTIIKASTLGEVRYLTDEQLAIARQPAPHWPQADMPPHCSEEKELRRQLCDFLHRGYRNRLLISTAGSFSARVDERSFVITPHVFDRQTAAISDLVLIRDGAVEQGKFPSRAARLHIAIYNRHADVRAIVNAFTVNATAFGVVAAVFDARTIPESYILLRDVQRIPFGQQFGDGREIAARLSMDQPAALLENDGVLVCGTSVLDAFDRLEVLESTAETVINARLIGTPAPMGDAALKDLAEAFFKT